MRLLIRLLQRLLVLGLGIASIWLIVFVVFRFADHRLPWVMALGVTYGLAAYIILPRAVRMGLKILQRRHIPRYTTTGDGLPGDPVNPRRLRSFICNPQHPNRALTMSDPSWVLPNAALTGRIVRDQWIVRLDGHATGAPKLGRSLRERWHVG